MEGMNMSRANHCSDFDFATDYCLMLTLIVRLKYRSMLFVKDFIIYVQGGP